MYTPNSYLFVAPFVTKFHNFFPTPTTYQPVTVRLTYHGFLNSVLEWLEIVRVRWYWRRK